MGPRVVVVRQICGQDAAQPGFGQDDDLIETLASKGTDHQLGYAFCHGERGAVRISSMPMPLAVVATAANASSRSCTR